MLAPKGTYPPFTPSKRDDIKNPIVDLPESVDAILEGIDAVILTHLHLDHFDDKAKEVLPKSINLYVQNEADAGEVQKKIGYLTQEVFDLPLDETPENLFYRETPYSKWGCSIVTQVENGDELKDYYQNVIRNQETGHSMIYRLTEGNDVFQVYSTSLYHEEEQVGTIFVHRDITKEYEVDQMKSEFVRVSISIRKRPSHLRYGSPP